MDSHDSEDPKQNTADMTAFVQNLLQQMQSRFQTMSESIIAKNILLLFHILAYHSLYTSFLLLYFVTYWVVFQHLRIMKSFYQSIALGTSLDEMGSRIDELEQSINDLRSEMGIEGSASPSLPSKSNDGPDQGSQ
ncbi:hypothetical protein CICLE_v10007067mg [Citrus x clementina]|uniref:Heat shock factor binding protein n=1 Tax=Citrus clementina TaxID=85681 RepID=V4RG17_CITCL|nr:hypothetical protein CICLE_v10007067mg [Citrus x clementina]